MRVYRFMFIEKEGDYREERERAKAGSETWNSVNLTNLNSSVEEEGYKHEITWDVYVNILSLKSLYEIKFIS